MPTIETVTRNTQDVFDRYLITVRPKLMAGAMHYRCNRVDEAEDLVQETLCQAWKRFSTFDPTRATFLGWCRLLMRHIVSDTARLSRPPVCSLEDVREHLTADERLNPAHVLEEKQIYTRLLNSLCPHEVQVALCMIEGMTEKEGASHCGITPSHYKSISRSVRPVLYLLLTSD